jgi:hypothetical protein
MTCKHTPGPWEIVCAPIKDQGSFPDQSLYFKIAGTHPMTHSLELAANARLIEAAPELLETLEAMCDAFQEILAHEYSCYEPDTPEYLMAKRVIAKAKGNSDE